MLSVEHEAIVRLFQARPELAADLLGGTLRVPLPEFDFADVEPADLTEVTPSEFRADSVIAYSRKRPDADPEPVLGVVVEVQRGRDEEKRWVWPMYLAAVRERLRCPTILLVVCPNPVIAHWCARPFELGQPGLTFTPLVAGPREIPIVVDPTEALDDPELAALSAITHARSPQAADILNSLFTAVRELDPRQGGLYADMVRAALPPDVWDHLEALLKTESREYLSEWARSNVERGLAQGKAQGRAEGKAEGKAEGILMVLSARGLDVPGDVRDEIRGCTDLERLDAWLRAAVTAPSARALLER